MFRRTLYSSQHFTRFYKLPCFLLSINTYYLNIFSWSQACVFNCLYSSKCHFIVVAVHSINSIWSLSLKDICHSIHCLLPGKISCLLHYNFHIRILLSHYITESFLAPRNRRRSFYPSQFYNLCIRYFLSDKLSTSFSFPCLIRINRGYIFSLSCSC